MKQSSLSSFFKVYKPDSKYKSSQPGASSSANGSSSKSKPVAAASTAPAETKQKDEFDAALDEYTYVEPKPAYRISTPASVTGKKRKADEASAAPSNSKNSPVEIASDSDESEEFDLIYKPSAAKKQRYDAADDGARTTRSGSKFGTPPAKEAAKYKNSKRIVESDDDSDEYRPDSNAMDEDDDDEYKAAASSDSDDLVGPAKRTRTRTGITSPSSVEKKVKKTSDAAAATPAPAESKLNPATPKQEKVPVAPAPAAVTPKAEPAGKSSKFKPIDFDDEDEADAEAGDDDTEEEEEKEAKKEKPKKKAKGKGKGSDTRIEKQKKERAKYESKPEFYVPLLDPENIEYHAHAASWRGGGADEDRKTAKNPGSKSVPLGRPNFLNGIIMIITGQLESLSRDECSKLIERYGGTAATSVTMKTNFVIVGEDPGKSKMDKAKKYGIKCINEDSFLEMIKKSNPDYANLEEQAQEEANREKKAKLEAKKLAAAQAVAAQATPVKTEKAESLIGSVPTEPVAKPVTPTKPAPVPAAQATPAKPAQTVVYNNLWSEKYRPKTSQDILGNQTHVKRMKEWLVGWEGNFLKGGAAAAGTAAAGGKKSKKEEMEEGIHSKRAVLLSGLPGIGKTTAATIIAKECGYSVVELNASDTRSKTYLREEVEGMTTNRSLSEFFTSKKLGSTKNKPRKTVLIMDEVDGMAGDGDRGGVAELVQMVKETKIPIICICNDHSKYSLKTLIKYCLDLKFAKPSKDNVVPTVYKIAKAEGVTADVNVIQHLYDSLNGDVRSILNNLYLMSANSDRLTLVGNKNDLDVSKTSAQPSVFDVVQQVFMKNKDYKTVQDLYFYDTYLIPAFVYENYVNIRPIVPVELKHVVTDFDTWRMGRLASSAESMSMGDIAGGLVRRYQQWTLSTAQGHMSVVYPGYNMRGKYESLRPGGWDRFYRFPSSLGKLSTTNKNANLLGQLHKSAARQVTGTATDFLLDYLPVLKHEVMQPLITQGKAGIDETIRRMGEYELTRDDLESMYELTLGKKADTNIFKGVTTAVKSAFTREYNKYHQMISRAKKTKLGLDDESDEEVAALEDEGELDEEEMDHKAKATLDEFAKKVKAGKNLQKYEKARDRADKKKSKATAAATKTKKRKRSDDDDSASSASTPIDLDDEDEAVVKKPAAKKAKKETAAASAAPKKGKLNVVKK